MIPSVYKLLHISRSSGGLFPAHRIQRRGVRSVSYAIQCEHLYAFFISIHPLGRLVKEVFAASDLLAHSALQQPPLIFGQIRPPVFLSRRGLLPALCLHRPPVIPGSVHQGVVPNLLQLPGVLHHGAALRAVRLQALQGGLQDGRLGHAHGVPPGKKPPGPGTERSSR